jgi:hypothetical protein
MFIASAYVRPATTYGGEVLGMRAQATYYKQLQQVQDRAIRLIVQGNDSLPDTTDPTTASLEFNIPPVAAVMAAGRARAYAKFPSSKTQVTQIYPAIMHNPLRRDQSWAEDTERWLRQSKVTLALHLSKIGRATLRQRDQESFTSYTDGGPAKTAGQSSSSLRVGQNPRELHRCFIQTVYFFGF